jgi:peptidoglycan/xylan/chitin deacetylase (PgdA/CDA1 family)
MRNLLFKIIRFSGLPWLFRQLVQRNKVSILLFHDIDPATAEKTFRCLAKRYNIIDLQEFLEVRRLGSAADLPPRALILTFDDGHIGNYALLPIIKKMELPVTIFLCAGVVDTKRHFWFTYEHPAVPKDRLKTLPNRERLEVLEAVGYAKEKEYESPQALNRDQIEEMVPWVGFQAHTLFHPCLPCCSDAEAREEIFESKRILETSFDLTINAFAYPNGDYSERDIALTREAGYACGITVDYGFNTLKTDPMRLKRLSVNDTRDLNELIVKASGVWGFFKRHN